MSEEKVLATEVMGQVKWFDKEKGYGFLTALDSKEYFVHYTGINIEGRMGYRYLNEKELVKFDVRKNEKGLFATNVTLVLTE